MVYDKAQILKSAHVEARLTRAMHRSTGVTVRSYASYLSSAMRRLWAKAKAGAEKFLIIDHDTDEMTTDTFDFDSIKTRLQSFAQDVYGGDSAYTDFRSDAVAMWETTRDAAGQLRAQQAQLADALDITEADAARTIRALIVESAHDAPGKTEHVISNRTKYIDRAIKEVHPTL
jgi:hypothetical protein